MYYMIGNISYLVSCVTNLGIADCVINNMSCIILSTDMLTVKALI